MLISIYTADAIKKKGRVYTFKNGSIIDVFLFLFIQYFPKINPPHPILREL